MGYCIRHPTIPVYRAKEYLHIDLNRYFIDFEEAAALIKGSSSLIFKLIGQISLKFMRPKCIRYFRCHCYFYGLVLKDHY